MIYIKQSQLHVFFFQWLFYTHCEQIVPQTKRKSTLKHTSYNGKRRNGCRANALWFLSLTAKRDKAEAVSAEALPVLSSLLLTDTAAISSACFFLSCFNLSQYCKTPLKSLNKHFLKMYKYSVAYSLFKLIQWEAESFGSEETHTTTAPLHSLHTSP